MQRRGLVLEHLEDVRRALHEPVRKVHDGAGRGVVWYAVPFVAEPFEDDDAGQRLALARGGEEGQPVTVLGDTVRYSFVRDPDGNYIEISQRASLTGGRL